MSAPSPKPLGDGTRIVHAGLAEPKQGAPLLEGPTLAAPFHLAGDPEASAYVYGRYGNPTWSAYERALGELDGGRALVFSSGMAAVSCVLLSTLRPGDVLVAPSDGYPALRALASDYLTRQAIEVRLVPTGTAEFEAALDRAALVWIESPSNPSLDVCDIAQIAHKAHAEGAAVAVDNTLATALGQRPLELGADYSVASDSKHLTGHGDVVLGHVATANRARYEALLRWRTQTGAIAGPFETWLAHRSLATLNVRLSRQCETAMAVAAMLKADNTVDHVRYPGLEDDPSHEVACRQMRCFGSVVCFCMQGRQQAERFLGALGLIAEATSFGGVHSTAERRARWAGETVPEGLVRLSVGCEDPEDLIADIAGALSVASGNRDRPRSWARGR